MNVVIGVRQVGQSTHIPNICIWHKDLNLFDKFRRCVGMARCNKQTLSILLKYKSCLSVRGVHFDTQKSRDYIDCSTGRSFD